VTVYDVNPKAVQAMVEVGAIAGDSSWVVGERSDVVLTSLPDSPHVKEALLGDKGALKGLKEGNTIIELSTIDPLTIKEVAAEAAKRGVRTLDAAVSGAPVKAREGTLTIMVGGELAVMEECRDILEVLGENIFHVGEIGMASTIKLVNNLITAVSMAVVGEAFALGVKAGADPKTMFEVISKSSGDCWALRTRVPYPDIVPESPANRDFAPGFMTDLMHKDLGLVLSLGKALNVPLLMGGLAYQLYGAASALGCGRKDFSAVSAVVRKLAGEWQ
jgi:3-hydroxyisobutyrate dehydrogenase